MAARVPADIGLVTTSTLVRLPLALLLLSCVPGGTQQPYQMSVNVDLVLLNAAVRDRKGAPVSDLREQDFAVFEDGVRQTLRLFRHEDIPVTVGLVVDHSGSMRAKLADVTAAARTFVDFSSPEDEMFVINFNERVGMGRPPNLSFTNRPDELAHAISDVPAAGQTALYDAIVQAQSRLKSGRHAKKVLLVISDGGDNASVHTQPEVLTLAAQSNTLIYAIGIFDAEDADRNPEVLKRLAQASGGDAYFPKEYGEVVEICERIARDIRHQYTLGYVSTNAGRPGAWRAIQVVARPDGKSKLTVRTRSGYFAAGEAPR
ncbi:MAG: von Willebrand factor, type [Candidatus Solibacter sp.]|nr:von Willebrand factor, type [Candidatus Solibacter sp.]